MNPGFGRPDQAPLESNIWDLLSQIPGTDCRETLELIYNWARHCEGIVVVNSPSVRSAVSAVLGALASGSRLGPARVYLADPRRQRLVSLYGELSKIDLACDVTLYHGSLTQFFRDLPLSADLICMESCGLAQLGGVQSSFSSGSVILGVNETLEPSREAAQYLIDAGMLEREAMTQGGTIYRTTRRCRSLRFVPRAGLRVELQGKLHERYFLSGAGADADHTPVADLAEDMRREFTRSFPGASGLGPWPFAAPEPGSLPLTLPSGKLWPKISIVTPTRNQGRYLEETILSVLHQDYPNVEYIVVDGASTDETPSILERYRDRLALVLSEPDNGQSHAINKGMSKATGDILTWLNGDDMLAPGALAAVALAFDLNRADMIAGICRLYRDGSLESQHLTCCADGPLPLEDLLDLDQCWNAGQFFIQPEVMFTREIWLRSGGRVNEALHYTMDYDLWLRFAQAGAGLHVIGRPLAWFRLHEEQKISARSSVALELTTCRDSFLRGRDLKPKSAPARTPWRQELRITVLNNDYGSGGGSYLRLASALAWAGHKISIVPVQDAPSRKCMSEGLLGQVSATHPDLVIVAYLNGVNDDSRLSHLLSKRFQTIGITGNTLAYGPSAEIIRSSCPLDVFRPRDKQACREELGLPLDRFLILLASGWNGAGNKSRALLEAIERLELPNVALVSTDPTTIQAPLKVIALGRVDDPRRAALLNSAVDIVVVPTAAETLEQAYIEATACGTPAVGYPVAAVREVIRPGVTVLLESDNKPTSLAAAVHNLYMHPDLRNDLAKWGRIYAENEGSDFSSYRSVFGALKILGLTRSLKLRSKIEFLPYSPQIPPIQNDWTESSS